VTAVPRKKLTVAEYLAIEARAEFRSEFHDGEMFLVPRSGPAHNKVKENLIVEIGGRLKGSRCRTYSSDQRVKVKRTGLYTYPDLIIVCGKPETDPDDPDTITNPQVVFEALSPSTERYDRGTKFRHFKKLPSVQEIVLVSQD
jgi:Uma2 family endonuclease